MTDSQLELISHPLCPFVQRAAALLTECGVPFTQRHVDLQNKPAWFLALSPRGKVPVLRVDGTTIFESNVILEYVAERFAPQLLTGDPLLRARRRMWMTISDDLLMTNYKVAVAATRADRDSAVAAAKETLGRFEPLLSARTFIGVDPAQLSSNDNASNGDNAARASNPDNAAPASNRDNAAPASNPVDAASMATKRATAKDAPGLIDFAAGPGLVRFEKLGRELGIDFYEGLPQVARWSRAIAQRAAFTRTLVADFDARFREFVRHELAA
ncbi:MAG TPA: glutathione S-transferase family protein [Kofleriaceae bacterium]|nr:glutathione S-transferase family protein [Kofleriaceae bacterium]